MPRNLEIIRGDKSIAGSIDLQQLVKNHVYPVPDGATIIDVSNLLVFKLQSTAPVVATLANGQEGQSVSLLGDGNTTVYGTLLLANKIYRFTYILGTWYPDA